MSYVRSSPTEGETVMENRRGRRQELARGWRFVCECSKCAAEAKETENLGQMAASATSTSASSPVIVEAPTTPISGDT
jgi:import receptor subunit TOM20